MSVDRFRIQRSQKIRMQSRDFTFRGPWTNETHCHFILSALRTHLWDENIPDSGYIKFIIIARPKPDCQLSIIYLLNFFFFLHSTGFCSGLFQDHSSLNSTGIIGPQNGNFGRAPQQESQGHDKDLVQSSPVHFFFPLFFKAEFEK